MSETYEALRLRCGHSQSKAAKAKPGAAAPKTGVEKAAELTLKCRGNLENGLKQFVRLNA